MGEGREGADRIGDDRVGQDKGWQSSWGLQKGWRRKRLELKERKRELGQLGWKVVVRSARLGACVREVRGGLAECEGWAGEGGVGCDGLGA